MGSCNALQKLIESFLETIVFVTPQRSRFEERILVLSDFRSFAIRVPSFFILATICVLLLPGEAKRSSRRVVRLWLSNL